MDEWFDTTRWSLIVKAQAAGTPEARAALAELCRSDWYPIYAYVRRSGDDADSAQDLTREFFSGWLERNLLRTVAPSKGRFRTFLPSASSSGAGP